MFKAHATYYTISDHSFFLGTVALLNSLHVTENSGELVILDAGLTSSERELLSEHATIFPAPKEIEVHPLVMKAYPSLLKPSGTVVLIDSDIVVTGSLASVAELAGEGKICVCPAWTPEVRRRWFQEWEQTLDLRSPLRREPWVHAGFVAFSTEHWPNLLERYWEVCERVPADEAFTSGMPFNAGDADALNALLMSEIPPGTSAVLPQGAEVFGGDIVVDDLQTLACSVDGRQTTMLHYPDRPKPWERSGWLRIGTPGYIRIMRRLLFATDVPLRLNPSQAPVWIRPTLAGELTLRALAVNRAIAWSVYKVPEPLRDRVRRLRRHLARKLSPA
jgi:hypothetical protein